MSSTVFDLACPSFSRTQSIKVLTRATIFRVFFLDFVEILSKRVDFRVEFSLNIVDFVLNGDYLLSPLTGLACLFGPPSAEFYAKMRG